MTEKPQTFQSAKAICENYDGFPAIIDSAPEKVSFIRSISDQNRNPNKIGNYKQLSYFHLMTNLRDF